MPGVDGARLKAYWERRKPQIIKRFRKATPSLRVPQRKFVSLNAYGNLPTRKPSENSAKWLERLDKWNRARDRWFIWAEDEAERQYSEECDRAWSQYTRDRFLWKLYISHAWHDTAK